MLVDQGWDSSWAKESLLPAGLSLVLGGLGCPISAGFELGPPAIPPQTPVGLIPILLLPLFAHSWCVSEVSDMRVWGTGRRGREGQGRDSPAAIGKHVDL